MSNFLTPSFCTGSLHCCALFSVVSTQSIHGVSHAWRWRWTSSHLAASLTQPSSCDLPTCHPPPPSQNVFKYLCSSLFLFSPFFVPHPPFLFSLPPHFTSVVLLQIPGESSLTDPSSDSPPLVPEMLRGTRRFSLSRVQLQPLFRKQNSFLFLSDRYSFRLPQVHLSSRHPLTLFRVSPSFPSMGGFFAAISPADFPSVMDAVAGRMSPPYVACVFFFFSLVSVSLFFPASW